MIPALPNMALPPLILSLVVIDCLSGKFTFNSKNVLFFLIFLFIISLITLVLYETHDSWSPLFSTGC